MDLRVFRVHRTSSYWEHVMVILVNSISLLKLVARGIWGYHSTKKGCAGTVSLPLPTSMRNALPLCH